ncbi:MAG: radical SAM family heme chaperone HemW [Oscillospiraceae bacterium]|nr:radical SAM family heme chaperone HemW [Oscillospiraceae bacterium]
MSDTLGVYIHIPFCASKCGYCDFYSSAACEKEMPRYQRALLSHIEETLDQLPFDVIDTVYFGGGTPSYYGAKRITELLDALKSTGRLLRDAEITMEANPDSMRPKDLRLLRRAGVNRLSIGMQSANNDLLKLIGRRHNFKQVQMAVHAARAAGFDNVSLDLIYGLPSQTRSDWEETLMRALQLHPEHISGYGLKLEPGTPMAEEYADSPLVPDEDTQADMYLSMVETLRQYGYRQYEISNFCITGYESRHNMKYWRLEDYVGFGPGAHSCVDGLRYSYVRDRERYVNCVLGGAVSGGMLDEYERIGDFERGAEYLMLGMRTARGVSEAEYTAIYNSSFDGIADTLDDYVRRGWAVEEDGRWHFTPAGFLISNTLIRALLDAQTDQLAERAPWMQPELDRAERQELPVSTDEAFEDTYRRSVLLKEQG